MSNHSERSQNEQGHISSSARTAGAEEQMYALSALQSQRNQLLERLMPLAEQPVSGNPQADATQISEPLKQFCAELVNYLAAGHYYILQHTSGGWTQRAAIAQTTERAMRFAAQHEQGIDEPGRSPSWHITRNQLDKLALLLTDRFDSEDQLLGDVQLTCH